VSSCYTVVVAVLPGYREIREIGEERWGPTPAARVVGWLRQIEMSLSLSAPRHRALVECASQEADDAFFPLFFFSQKNPSDFQPQNVGHVEALKSKIPPSPSPLCRYAHYIPAPTHFTRRQLVTRSRHTLVSVQTHTRQSIVQTVSRSEDPKKPKTKSGHSRATFSKMAAAEYKDEGEAEAVEEEEVKGIKMAEVEQHQSIDDLWLVIDGRGGGAQRGRGHTCVSNTMRVL
jgi:hypothetical protein